VTHDVEEAIFLGDRIAVFSPRPARLMREFTVPFGKDRSRSITGSREYLAFEQEVLGVIRSEFL
jgi:NitT/TauT family transport system ATP-binding protein